MFWQGWIVGLLCGMLIGGVLVAFVSFLGKDPDG